jgi:kumamolisin
MEGVMASTTSSGEPGGAKLPLGGSTRQPLRNATRVGDVDAEHRVLVSIIVRRPPNRPAGEPLPADASPAERRARVAEQSGADPDDLRAVERFAVDAGLEVRSVDAARRTVMVEGPASAMAAAFDVDLARYRTEDGVTYRGREGDVHVPADLEPVIDAVLGLDDRPQARAHFHPGEPVDEAELGDPTDDPVLLSAGNHLSSADAVALKKKKQVAASPLWPAQVAQLYDFPTSYDGSGQTIGIIELGGGFRQSELTTYFTKALAGTPHAGSQPTVTAVNVDHGSNQPGGEADGEVLLDIQVAGAIAPAADIVVYFADPSDRGFIDAVTTALHDTTHAPSVVSISWGGPEDTWTSQARAAFDAALSDADALGVTVLAAAGDHGAGDAEPDGHAHTDYPAASPYIVSCGGTTLIGQSGTTVSEIAWNDHDGWATGGGISEQTPKPAWQTATMPPNVNGSSFQGRGVPDVAGNADIVSGFWVLVDGKWTPIGGTSAVAPLYAGLLALVNQAINRPVTRLTRTLYGLNATQSAQVLRDIDTGTNTVPQSQYGPAVDGYDAQQGWDACTGLGSIKGKGLVELLQTSSSS